MNVDAMAALDPATSPTTLASSRTALRVAEFDDIERLITQAQARMVQELLPSTPEGESDTVHVTGLHLVGALKATTESDPDDHDAPGARGAWLGRLNARMFSSTVASAWMEFASHCDTQRLAILDRRHALGTRIVTVPRQPSRDLYAALVCAHDRLANNRNATPTPQETEALDQCRVNGHRLRSTAEVAAAIAAVEITQLRHLLTLRWTNHMGPLHAPMISASEPEVTIAAHLEPIAVVATAALSDPTRASAALQSPPVARPDRDAATIAAAASVAFAAATSNALTDAQPTRPQRQGPTASVRVQPTIVVAGAPEAKDDRYTTINATPHGSFATATEPDAPYWVVLETRNGRLTLTVDRSLGSTEGIGSVKIISLATGKVITGALTAVDSHFELDAEFLHPGDYAFVVESSSGRQKDVFTALVSMKHLLAQSGAARGVNGVLDAFARVNRATTPAPAPAAAPPKPNFFVVLNIENGQMTLTVDRTFGGTDTVGKVVIIDRATGREIECEIEIVDGVIHLKAAFQHPGMYDFIVYNSSGTHADTFTAPVSIPHYFGPRSTNPTATAVRSVTVPEHAAMAGAFGRSI